ncbi:unnamed protein product [Auanema sp. JU1783]|nr:unnamed protein product [Auanema sp. JU1783]
MELTSLKSDSLHNPILFHNFHGENIELLEHRQRALRRASFEKGVVFSERPLDENEYFFVSIETVEGGWSGHLRVGLTIVQPDLRPSISDFERNSWLLSVSPSMVPNSEPASHALPTEEGSLIGVYYERLTGRPRLHVVLNGFDVCPDVGHIPSDQLLYAAVDVFGSTKEIRVVLPHPREPNKLSSLCYAKVNCMVQEGKCSASLLPGPIRCAMEKATAKIYRF